MWGNDIALFLFFFLKQKTAYEVSACLVGSEMWYKRQVYDLSHSMFEYEIASRVLLSLSP